MLVFAVGHNNNNEQGRTSVQNDAVAINAISDLLLLSDSDMLVYLSSKFPKVAGQRAVCPQRRHELKGHPRHALAKMSKLLSRVSLEGGGVGAPLTEQTRKELLDFLPGGSSNSCMQAEEPLRACACYFKMGHIE